MDGLGELGPDNERFYQGVRLGIYGRSAELVLLDVENRSVVNFEQGRDSGLELPAWIGEWLDAEGP